MSHTYHTKHEFREMTLGQDISLAKADCVEVVRARLSRHPNGTKAHGLRKDKRRGKAVKYRYAKARFGETDEQSYRLRRLKRAGTRTARRRNKQEENQ